MNINEILKEKEKTKIELMSINLKQIVLNNKLVDLNKAYNDILLNGFLDYLTVGDQFTLTKMFFGASKDIFIINPQDVIEIVKKNKKTVIVKYVKKFSFNADRSDRTETSPNTLFKVDLNKLFDIYKSDTDFKKRLISSINRKMKLDELGI